MSNNNRQQPIQPQLPKSVRTALMLANGSFYHFDQTPDEVVRALEALKLGSEHFVRFTGDHRDVYLSKLCVEPLMGQMPNPMAVVSVMEVAHVQVAAGSV